MKVFKRVITLDDVSIDIIERQDGVECANYLRGMLPTEVYQISLGRGENRFKYKGRIFRLQREMIHQDFGGKIKTSCEWYIEGWNNHNRLTAYSKKELIEAINKKFVDDLFRSPQYVNLKSDR